MTQGAPLRRNPLLGSKATVRMPNSVSVRSRTAPPEVTVVGIPAHPVDRQEARPSFDAYGTPEPCLDPLLHEVALLRDELTALERRIGELTRDPIL